MHNKQKRNVIVRLLIENQIVECKGRLIGLVNENEFKKLLCNVKIRKRVGTSPSVSLKTIYENLADLSNLRIVIKLENLRKFGNDYEFNTSKSTIPLSKKEKIRERILVTERLGLISQINPLQETIEIISETDNTIVITEVKERMT